QLHLPVDLLRAPRDQDVVIRSDDRAGMFEEQDRFGRWRGARLGGVGRIVLPDAQHGLWSSDRGSDPEARRIAHLGQLPGGQGGTCALYTVSGQEGTVDVADQ